MKPVIHTFEFDKLGEPINGAYKLGVLPAGMTVWTVHTNFVNGRPTLTIIGDESFKPPPSKP